MAQNIQALEEMWIDDACCMHNFVRFIKVRKSFESNANCWKRRCKCTNVSSMLRCIKIKIQMHEFVAWKTRRVFRYGFGYKNGYEFVQRCILLNFFHNGLLTNWLMPNRKKSNFIQINPISWEKSKILFNSVLFFTKFFSTLFNSMTNARGW